MVFFHHILEWGYGCGLGGLSKLKRPEPVVFCIILELLILVQSLVSKIDFFAKITVTGNCKWNFERAMVDIIIGHDRKMK